MMGIPDSHCHLDMEEFDADREAVLDRGRSAGITAFLCPGEISNARSLRVTLDLAARYPDFAAAAGLHPHQAKLRSEAHSASIRALAAEKKIVAVGEIGLDFHYDFASPSEQGEAFRAQLALARELGLPAIVHSRLAGAEIREAVDTERFDTGGVLHCFTESWGVAEAMLDRGFLISFSGILTFPKASDLRDVAARVPLDRLLVETDAPYLAPIPHRGKRNEPAFVFETARFLASLLRIPFEAFAAAVTENYRKLFPLV